MLSGTTFICTLTFSSARFIFWDRRGLVSIRPRSIVGRATVVLIRSERSGFEPWPRSKRFSCVVLLGVKFTDYLSQCLTLQCQCVMNGFSTANLHWGIYTLIYTSELIICSTIYVHSATRHNIYMYRYFLFASIHHLDPPWLSLSDPVAKSAEQR